MGRRQARELAFRTLFQSERGSEPLLDVWRSVRIELAEEADSDEDDAYAAVYGDALDHDDLAFAEQLLKSFDADRERLDEELGETITGWSFGQMSQTDLNVLRIALTEMRHTTGPDEVAIEMAVRLAKKFGGDESGKFVNGVLAKLHRRSSGAVSNGGGKEG